MGWDLPPLPRLKSGEEDGLPRTNDAGLGGCAATRRSATINDSVRLEKLQILVQRQFQDIPQHAGRFATFPLESLVTFEQDQLFARLVV